jgi:hypothetical protein
MYGILRDPSPTWLTAVPRQPYCDYRPLMVPLIRRHLIAITKAIHDTVTNFGGPTTSTVTTPVSDTSIDVMRIIPQLIDNGSVMPDAAIAMAIQVTFLTFHPPCYLTNKLPHYYDYDGTEMVD